LDILENTMIENRRSHPALWLVLLAAAGTFALTMGTRQTMGLFLSPINTSTGLGLGSISLAFAFGQLFWGLTQPFAGAVADRIGAGRVLLAGVLLVALGTWHHAADDQHGGADLRDWRAVGGRRRHGRAGGADGRHHAACYRPAGAGWPRALSTPAVRSASLSWRRLPPRLCSAWAGSRRCRSWA
jgi:hypothetical protein